MGKITYKIHEWKTGEFYHIQDDGKMATIRVKKYDDGAEISNLRNINLDIETAKAMDSDDIQDLVAELIANDIKKDRLLAEKSSSTRS